MQFCYKAPDQWQLLELCNVQQAILRFPCFLLQTLHAQLDDQPTHMYIHM